MAISYSIIQKHLEKLLVKLPEDVSVTERTEIQILREKFSCSRAPFRLVTLQNGIHIIQEPNPNGTLFDCRPLDMFDVNYATAASLIGLTTTYVIVLLQFKLSDV